MWVNADVSYLYSGQKMVYTILQLSHIRDNFLSELQSARKGCKSSLSYFKTHLPDTKDREREHLVLVVGGTSLKRAYVKVEKGVIYIRNYETGVVPALKNKTQLLGFFASQIPTDVKDIIINFAFPIDPITREARVDGIILRSTKEHRLEGLHKSPIGRSLEDYILYKRHVRVRVNIANDVSCLTLSGLAKASWDRIIGLIVGTGTNSGFCSDKNTVVNLESANFNKFTQTPTGKRIDNASNKPGQNRFEKEVAGAYLYEHYNMIMEAIGAEYKPIRSTRQLSELASDGEPEKSSTARALFERSASLLSAQIAGIHAFKGARDLTIIIEGSLFWHGWRYQRLVKGYCRDLDISDSNITFLHIDKSDIKGAARLILL